jgi:uncharacterized protein
MQPSVFNVRVPLPGEDVFLMNTLTDAQLVVSPDVAALLDRIDGRASFEGLAGEERETADLLRDNGFLVEDRDSDHLALDRYFSRITNDSSELHITVLTTLQCNFACDYCFQGDHGDYNKFAEKMSLDTAVRTAAWVEREMDRVAPEHVTLMFFGGEPLLNLPVMYYLAGRLHGAAGSRGIDLGISIITNGLLLTPEIVDRLLPFGLRGVKITLDGDRDTHDRMRPLRGGQGTFDRIVQNIRAVADRVAVSIGGNFDEASVDSYPALLDYLKEQEFADKLVKVNFKPIVRGPDPSAVEGPGPSAVEGSGLSGVEGPVPTAAKGIIPLTLVGMKPLGGTCMTTVGEGLSPADTCGSCNFAAEKMAYLREETVRRGFPTPDGIHNGPCHVHAKHAHTIGPDGSLYACPGFTGEKGLSTGHIDDRRDAWRETAREQFDRLHPWKECGDCAYIPVCAGGCLVASHTQLGDMNLPTCHKPSYESALISLAHTAAGLS